VRENVLPSDDSHVLEAEAGDTLVGMVVGEMRETYPVFEHERYGYVTDVVVAPEARRRGVGRALFESLGAWFVAKGVSHLELRVAHQNSVSQAFWRAMGCTDFMLGFWYDLEAE